MKYIEEKGVSLILISFTALFLELAMIRWLPANVLSLAYFSNIVLISSFLGLGLGCLIASNGKDYFKWFPLALLTAVIIFISFRWLEVIVPSGGSEWIWSSYTGNNINRVDFKIGILPTLAIVFIINAVLFSFIGQKVGLLLKQFKPLKAYSLDLIGSILGITAFGLISFIGGQLSQPAVWFSIAGIISLFFVRNNRIFFSIGAIGVILMTIVILDFSKNEIWSPYYNIQTLKINDGSVKLYVNKFFHQQAVDFEKDLASANKYGLSYNLKTPEKVLVLGAGTGNDVAIALKNGATEVHAVEIDPIIAKLGHSLHPNKPYSDPRVKVFVDDARSFLKKGDDKYDMIILGTLDSHALLSAMSTVRLDNFVYTIESLEEVKGRLDDDGLAILMFSVPQQWLGEKLINMATEVFNDPLPLAYLGDGNLFNLMIVAGPGLKYIPQDKLSSLPFLQLPPLSPSLNSPTDDWPYLYLASHSIPAHYLKVIAVLILISCLAVLSLLPKTVFNLSGLNFFSLGVAFLLLETKSITTLSLLFGSTWIVNAFVFGGILTMVLIANILVSKITIKKIEPFYILLGTALILNYILPIGLFLGENFWVKSIFSSLFVALPIFFASIIFSYHFKSAQDINALFGINLMGAVLGGFVEYSSMAGGLNILYLFAGVFYLISYLSYKKS